MTTLNDGDRLDQAKNLELKRREEMVLLRQRIRDRIYMTICCNPLNQIETNIDKLTEWVLGLLGSEVKSWPPAPEDGVFGLTAEQIFHLKMFYEAKTGKKAADI